MFDPGHSLYSIQNGHGDVNDQNVGIQGRRGFYERGSVTNSSNHVIVRRKRLGDVCEYSVVIIG